MILYRLETRELCKCEQQIRKMYANPNLLLRKLSKYSINVNFYLFKTYFSIKYILCTHVDFIVRKQLKKN